MGEEHALQLKEHELRIKEHAEKKEAKEIQIKKLIKEADQKKKEKKLLLQQLKEEADTLVQIKRVLTKKKKGQSKVTAEEIYEMKKTNPEGLYSKLSKKKNRATLILQPNTMPYVLKN